MHRNIAMIVLMAVVCLLVAVPSSFAERLKKPSERIFDVEPSEVMLAVHFDPGYLTGRAADLLDSLPNVGEAASGEANKIVIAVSVSLEYILQDHWSVQGTLERAWKDLPDDYPTIMGWSLGAGLQYRLLAAGKRSPFLRVEGGRIWASADGYDGESENYWRVGIGMFEYTTPTTNLRLELFYRSIMSKNNEVFGGTFDSDGFNVEYIGVDFGVGFNL